MERNKESEEISAMDKERSSALTDDDMDENQNVERGSDFSKSSIGKSQEAPADVEKAHELTEYETLTSITSDNVEVNIDELGNHSDNKLDPTETETSPEELNSQEEPKLSNGTSETESPKKLCHEGSPVGLTIDTVASDDAKKCDGKAMFLKPASSEKRLEEDVKEFRASHLGIEADAKVKRRELLTGGCDLANSYGLGKKHTTDREATTQSGYGIVDPLDIARQVAIEVEREVGEYREQSSNSPEINAAQSHDISEDVSKEELHVSGDDSNNYSNTDSDNDSKTHEETISGNTDAEQMNEAQDMAISQVTEGATTEINAQKVSCGFDLNQVSSEDVENPTSHGSTTAAFELPVAPLQFEGNFGWKSSASSTIQPASPHKTRENEKETHGRESSSSKKREVFLDLDLNVAENLDSSHHSHKGEFYAGTSSRKTEAFPLDLNHASGSGYGGAPQQGWLMPGNFLPSQSMLQQHSSSSSKQPLSFLDLNDQPSFLNSSSDNSKFSGPLQMINAFGASNSKETEISLFGAKVQINAEDGAHPRALSLQNGRTHDLAFTSNNTRQTQSFFGPPMVQYTNSPSVNGYNTTQHPGPTIPLPSAVYGPGGPIPYMVDSRGAPVIPQIMGSGSSFAQPLFLMSTSNGANPLSNGARSGFDLNSGNMMDESGGSSSSSIRDNRSFGQFLNLGQLRPVDEHVGSTSQTTTVAGQKRQEPENGWENYGLRPYPPPWM